MAQPGIASSLLTSLCHPDLDHMGLEHPARTDLPALALTARLAALSRNVTTVIDSRTPHCFPTHAHTPNSHRQQLAPRNHESTFHATDLRLLGLSRKGTRTRGVPRTRLAYSASCFQIRPHRNTDQCCFPFYRRTAVLGMDRPISSAGGRLSCFYVLVCAE